MALFNKKTATKKVAAKTVVAKEVTEESTQTVAPQKAGRALDLTMVLVRPHITEKATDLSEQNVYAFQISKLANKMHVRQAIEKFYKVRPVKIAIMNGKPKYMRNHRTGRMQVKKTGDKKALVYLKKGDTIEFV